MEAVISLQYGVVALAALPAYCVRTLRCSQAPRLVLKRNPSLRVS